MGQRVILAGATGTIGRATALALLAAGHEVICPVRDPARAGLPDGVRLVRASLAEPGGAATVTALGADAVISCLASRTGAPADAWAVDHGANLALLEAAEAAGVRTFVLLSAICVQQPELAFQQAKLAIEARLRESALTHAIVRPTAFFKSLSGQMRRVREGRPFLLFGDGGLTACKPISDGDLAAYLVRCLDDPALQNRTLPIGGPGPALTAGEQGEAMFAALGQAPRFRQVPVRLMDAIVGGLALVGRASRRARAKAELARIGRYYATHSMLVWDPVAGRYDADATPETGTETLPEFYARLAAGEARVDLGAHGVF